MKQLPSRVSAASLKLQEPSEEHTGSFFAMLSELEASGELTRLQQLALLRPEEYFRAVRENASRSLRWDRPTISTFWITNRSSEVVGEVHLSRTHAGSAGEVGYLVRPSRRGQGCATVALALALRWARASGISEVRLSCDADNLASAAVIHRNGGEFVGEDYSFVSESRVLHFKVDLSHRWHQDSECQMSTRMIIAFDSAIPGDLVISAFDLSQSFATVLGEPVLLASLEGDLLDDLRAWTFMKTQGKGLEGVEPRGAVSNAPMSSAPFVYREDGRPDWGAMWGGFCELALYGGPPHRGADNPVLANEAQVSEQSTSEALAEIRRGIFETTGLYSEPAGQGWLAVTCHSKRMAAWMCAAIILENVDSRCEDEVLYVPASPGFELKNEVKSVITVVAKVNHYWQAHIAEQEAQARAP
jgi:predicted acetyltransferase